MKKNGFVFIESIVVLVVVALSLAMLISSYSLIKRKTQEKELYDKASDKYLLYSISNLGTDDRCNYSIKCSTISGETFKDDDQISFRADATGEYACTKSKLGNIIFNCTSVFDEMHIVHIYVVSNIIRDLNENCSDDPKCSINYYDSGTLEYMKSLKKCNDTNFTKNSTTCSDPIGYMIGVFERDNGELHYASIEIEVPDRNGWELINKKTPVTDQQWVYWVSGHRATGLQFIPFTDGSGLRYYYFGDNGIMITGWVELDGNKYFFNSTDSEGNGNLNGERLESMKIKIDNTEYTFDSNGVCVAGPCSTASGHTTNIDWSSKTYYSG